MAVATATFLVNLLCSVVSCDVPLPTPEIVEPQEFGGFGQSSISSLASASSLLTPKVLGSAPIVNTNYGSLQGYVMKTVGNRDIYAFEGVPYAEPPVGYWRFRTASPKRPWHTLREATYPGPECLQLSLPKVLRVLGSEDCLYLNIYTPQLPYLERESRQYIQPMPVIINIHGGSYYFGSGNELGPAYLLIKDVLLVTINSRLGVLGYMSSGDSQSPGNYGLKDQAMAIQWVYENIANFGGDPDRITLLGQSSGAASAHLHLIANKTTPYFTSGVSLSGSAFNYWAIDSPTEARRLTTTISKSVNCPIADSSEMVNCLRQKNSVELVSSQFPLLEFSPFPVTLFSPVIEPPGQDAYLTQKPDAAYAQHQVGRKPWIFGMVAQEGYLGLLMLQSVFVEGTLRSRWNELAPIYLDYKYSARNVSTITEKLTKFYFGHRTPKNVAESKLAAIFGDRLMLSGVNKGIQAHSNIAPTFAYIFGFKGKYTLGSRVGRSSLDWGVGHAEDLYYYFNSSMWYPGFKKSDVDEYAMSNVMTGMLANFVTRGEPLLTEPNEEYVRVWEPVHPKNIRFLQLNRELKMISQPYRKRLDFWSRLGQFDPKVLNPLYDS